MLKVLKFLAGVALGSIGCSLYATRFIMELVQEYILNITFLISLVCILIFIEFASITVLFAHQWFSKNVNFILSKLILIAPLVLALINPHLLFLLILTYSITLLLPLRHGNIGKCPNCGAELKDTKDMFTCPVCFYDINGWAFTQIESFDYPLKPSL